MSILFVSNLAKITSSLFISVAVSVEFTKLIVSINSSVPEHNKSASPRRWFTLNAQVISSPSLHLGKYDITCSCGWLDPCQRPYFQICKELNLPCYGDEEQFFKMTDKHAFKKMCEENNVDTIPEFSEDDIKAGCVQFPVFVKPVDSRGSRGQAVCYNMDELIPAMEFARSESSNGDFLVEKYIRGSQEFHVTYFFVDGEPYLLRTSDNYCGSEYLFL